MKRHEHRQAQRRAPNYMAAVLAAMRAQVYAPGKVYPITVFHDDCCAIWRGRPCNCTPIVRASLVERDEDTPV